MTCLPWNSGSPENATIARYTTSSVTSKDVGDALAAKNYTIDRRKIQLDEPIKQLGEHKLAIRLHKDVTVEVTVSVVREG